MISASIVCKDSFGSIILIIAWFYHSVKNEMKWTCCYGKVIVGGLCLPIAALDNEDSALAHRDERAVFGDFVGDGVLEASVKRCILEGILTAIYAYALGFFRKAE